MTEINTEKMAHDAAEIALDSFECQGRTIREWIKIIADQDQKFGKWIPISEVLPNDGEWAIFTNGTQISIERYKMDALDHFYPSGRWFELEDVVAWMPLPKPYKPQEEEK